MPPALHLPLQISAYQATDLGAINTTCYPAQGWGLWANCMTAACIRGGPGGEPTAWDGSPVTCYCPIQNATAGQYQVGAPFTADQSTLCDANLPYLLSGKPLTSA